MKYSKEYSKDFQSIRRDGRFVIILASVFAIACGTCVVLGGPWIGVAVALGLMTICCGFLISGLVIVFGAFLLLEAISSNRTGCR